MNFTRMRQNTPKRLFYLGLLPFMLVTACGDTSQRRSNTIRVTSSSSVAAKLAALEQGHEGPEQVVTVTAVRQFEQALQSLARMCEQSETEIADMATVAVLELRKQGKRMRYLEMLRGIEQLLQAANAEPNRSTDCRVVFASAVTVLER